MTNTATATTAGELRARARQLRAGALDALDARAENLASRAKHLAERGYYNSDSFAETAAAHAEANAAVAEARFARAVDLEAQADAAEAQADAAEAQADAAEAQADARRDLERGLEKLRLVLVGRAEGGNLPEFITAAWVQRVGPAAIRTDDDKCLAVLDLLERRGWLIPAGENQRGHPRWTFNHEGCAPRAVA